MKNYEITFIVDPVLSGDEIKATAQTYVDQLQEEGATIVHVDEMGLRQLAYPINKRSSGIYYTLEFSIEDGTPIDKLELALRRDERIMRFLTVRLDKYGVKYNEDKRKGLIGKVKKKAKKSDDRGRDRDRRGGRNDNRSSSKSKSKAEAKPKTEPAKAEAKPKAEPAKAEAKPKAEPVKAEAKPKAEPAKAEAKPKAEPKAEPVKAAAAVVAEEPKQEEE